MRQQIANLSRFVDEADCGTITSLQGDVAYCQSAVRERLKRLVGQGGARGQNGTNGLQGGPSAQNGSPLWSVDPDFAF